MATNCLWYEKPAAAWVEALPLGNGRLGAMMFGGALDEKISINEDTFWSGIPRDNNVADAANHLPQAQQLVRDGLLAQAQRLVEDTMEGPFTEAYLPFCDIRITHRQLHKQITEYRRSLKIDTAISQVSFLSNGVRYRRESFVSHPDQAWVMHLSADKKGAISFEATLHTQVRGQLCADGCMLALDLQAPCHVRPNYVRSQRPIVYGQTPQTMGMRARGLLNVVAQGGKVVYEQDCLSVAGADSATLFFCARTSFHGFDKHPFTQGIDEKAAVLADMQAVIQKPYALLRDAHAADVAALLGRVDFHLDMPRAENLSTAARMTAFAKKPYDPVLYELIFQYGRYLLAASSRPGTQAANLQGIWNEQLRAPWSSNYTLNINTQMNYWPAEPCALPELHGPLFDLIDRLRVCGARTAKAYYQAAGASCNHNTDLWGLTNPVGESGRGSAVYAVWPMALGWLCRHLMDHYDYTLDCVFLRQRVLPALTDAAQFFLDVLQETGCGCLALYPATSPENTFFYQGEEVAVARWSTMNNAIIKEVFGNLLRCGDILQQQTPLMMQVQKALVRLPAYQVGKQGQLLEWDQEYQEAEVHHRHISHLYPLHPGREFTLETTPQMAQAVRRSLEIRGDEGTGWSLGWKISQWARLRQADRALRLLKRQLQLVPSHGLRANQGGTYLNLFGAHPPFQIDGNFAASAGIAEMLLQNSNGNIVLLPALPQEWTDGHITGLRAFGGIEVDQYFCHGTLHRAVLRRCSGAPASVRVQWQTKVKTIFVAACMEVILSPVDFL